MEYCPPLHTDFPCYILLQHILSCISIPIDILTLFCIFFKSTRAMKTYRWHLLWHQTLIAGVDFLTGVAAVPIYLLPFPVVYPTSFIKSLLPTHISVILIFLLITISLAAVVQLFVYRYLKTTGRTKFPRSSIALLLVTYLVCATPSIGFELIYPRDQIIFFQQLSQVTSYLKGIYLAQNYSCISEELQKISGIVGYPPDQIGHYVGAPILLVNLFMVAVCSILIYWTRNCLRGKNLSPNTVKLERKFLVSLILQVLSPVLIVHAPGLVFMYIQAMKVYGFEVVGLVCVSMLSVSGAVCGLFTILLTPSYRAIFLCWKTRKVPQSK